MTAILSLVPQNTPRGRFEALVFNMRLRFGTHLFEFLGLATIIRNVRSQFEAPRRLSQATAGPS